MNGLRAVALLALLSMPGAAFADAAPSDMAADAACRLDRIREIVAGAVQHSATEEEANRLILENTADWLPDYNSFATGPEAAGLLAAASAITGKPTRAQCRQFLPFAAVSASALAVQQAGGDVAAGSVLAACESGDGTCISPAAANILEQCRFRPISLPLQSTC